MRKSKIFDFEDKNTLCSVEKNIKKAISDLKPHLTGV